MKNNKLALSRGAFSISGDKEVQEHKRERNRAKRFRQQRMTARTFYGLKPKEVK